MLESNVTEKTLLKIEGLKKYFVNSSGIIKRKVDYIKAVDNVSFSINKGETFGLAAESPLAAVLSSGCMNLQREKFFIREKI